MKTMMTHRKIAVFIAMSLDGFIAGPNEDMSFLDSVAHDKEDYGYGDFIKQVDTVIIGRKTFDWVTKQTEVFPHRDKTTYVISRSPKQTEPNLEYYSGSLKDLIQMLRQQPGDTIFVDGGASIVNQLISLKAIDELTVSIIPVMLGGGTRLFDKACACDLKLVNTLTFPSGLVQLSYNIFY